MAKLTHSLAVLAALGLAGTAVAQDAVSDAANAVTDGAAALVDGAADAAGAAVEAAGDAAQAAGSEAVEAVSDALSGAGNAAADAATDVADAATDAAGDAAAAVADAVTGTEAEADETTGDAPAAGETAEGETAEGEAAAEGETAAEGEAVAEAPAAPVTMDKAPEDAPVGTIYLREVHGDWALRCFKAPEGQPDPCELYQLLRDEQGTEVAFVSLVPLLDGQQVKAGATIVGPLGTLLTEGLRIQVDQGQAQRYEFVVCETDGCMARIGLTGDDVTRWKRGNVAKISIASVYGDKVALPLSLTGFTAGYDSLGQIAREAQEAAKAAAEAAAAAAATEETASE